MVSQKKKKKTPSVPPAIRGFIRKSNGQRDRKIKKVVNNYRHRKRFMGVIVWKDLR